MYFSFLFVLRAVAKAKPLLLRYNFTSGVADGKILTIHMLIIIMLNLRIR